MIYIKHYKKTALKRLGILIAIASFIGLWINRPRIFSTEYEDTILKQTKRESDSLRSLLDTCQYYHDKHNLIISNMNDSLIVLTGLIKQEQNKIVYLKNHQYEKINNVSKFTSDDISKFLSDRYKDSIN